MSKQYLFKPRKIVFVWADLAGFPAGDESLVNAHLVGKLGLSQLFGPAGGLTGRDW